MSAQQDQQSEKIEHMNAEAAIRQVFETVLRVAFAEMYKQNESGEGGSPVSVEGVAEGENGQSFKLTLECQPPPASEEPELIM